MNALTTVLNVIAEFNGQNHSDLAQKYKLTIRTVFKLISLVVQTANVQLLSSAVESPVDILWADKLSQLDSPQGYADMHQAVQRVAISEPHNHVQVALVVLRTKIVTTAPDSSPADSSAEPQEIQQDIPFRKSDRPAASAPQQALASSPSMSPFTLFFAHLVGLVGAENAAQMVREFAGKTIQFPITDHYEQATTKSFGFSSSAPVLGAGYARPPVDRTTLPLQIEPHHSSAQTISFCEALLPAQCHPQVCSSPELPLRAVQIEPTHSVGPLEIESLQLDLSGS